MIELVAQHILPAALSLLPSAMDSKEARALVLATGLQESSLAYRQQVGGPAHGLWQFERGGTIGVMRHPVSRTHALQALNRLQYSFDEDEAYQALVHNDVLACTFARLLIYTLPSALPKRDDLQGAYDQYIKAWRPGKPRPAAWAQHHSQAWTLVG